MINTTIGKYKIIRLIGEGGMAAVYEAEHEMLGTRVAIKVLNPILSANAQIKERFRNEAKVMASLEHSNITKVIDFDEQPQQLSIVMEFLNGEDLSQRIKRKGPLSEKEITEVFSQTLKAFQYAHEKGIVHRDIKPSNIFILPDGQVKILDFGIAKLFGQGSEMTQTGTQMGTPIYMSPEQVKADKTIDHRSDIYSIGVTMYFAVNGKPPYNPTTHSQFDIFNKIVYEPLHEFSVQSRFNDMILKACQKNREERFQNCIDFLTKMGSPAAAETIYNDKTIIETSTAGRTIPETNNKKNSTQESISENENSVSKPNKKTYAHSLLFHLMPGVGTLFFTSFFYQTYPYFELLQMELWMLASILMIFIGFYLFRKRLFKSDNFSYQIQKNRILYLIPGLILLIITNYQHDLYQVFRADALRQYNDSIFPETYYVGESNLEGCSMLSLILMVGGFGIYFIKANKVSLSS